VTLLPIALGIGLLGLAFQSLSGSSSSSSSSTPKPKPNGAKPETDAQRVIRESKEIIDGARDSYSPDEDALQEAAALAAIQELEREAANAAPPKPAPKPGDTQGARPPVPKPVVVAPVVAPPKPAPVVVAPPKPAPAPYVVAPPRPAPTPAPVVAPPKPSPSVRSPVIPAGYDPAGARKLAPSLARHLKNKGRAGYDRVLLQQFQTKAGITPDKVYGGESAGALRHYGGTDAPPPFFPPLQVVTYVPPEQRKQ
jgi:hypothetical protein